MSSKKVLIIEDEAAFSYALQAKLKVAGFEVLEALDGEAGLEILQTEKTQVIVLDLILPGMDGFEVLEKIKQDPELRGIPVVMLTNMSEKKGKQRGLDLGVKDYLAKTEYKLDEIIEKIRELSQS